VLFPVKKNAQKKKLRRQSKPLPTSIKKRSHFGTEYRKAPPPQKGEEKSMGIKLFRMLRKNMLG